MPPGHTLAPGADSGSIAAVLDRLEREVSQSALPAATIDRIVLVAGELASNAAEHGSEMARLWWSSRAEGGDLCVSPGPDPSAVQRAALPETDAVGGRGLFLVRTLGDGVDADAETVRIRFQRRVGE